ncbi:hypothetical protein [Dyadobacter sp. 22481]|uniref:hypothetical protein n=1 Tax=Dyadobacter sp. 22481 TaxID=3453926 RepID=UPI003F84BAFF
MTADSWQKIDLFLNIWGNIFTICSAGLAMYLYWINREKISEAVSILLNYSTYASLVDLRLILEKLVALRYSTAEDKAEIIAILSEIDGHISGHKALRSNQSLLEFQKKIKIAQRKPEQFSEARKRSLANELRGIIKDVQVDLNVKN